MTFLQSSRLQDASAATMTSLMVNMGVPDIPPRYKKISQLSITLSNKQYSSRRTTHILKHLKKIRKNESIVNMFY